MKWWLIGWEAINLYDTATFDTACQYRWKYPGETSRTYAEFVTE